MKRQAYTTIAILIALTLSAAVANAQATGSTMLIANIPFGFFAGNKVLPAGEYRLCSINPQSEPVMLQLVSRDGSTSVIIPVHSARAKIQESSKLVFNRYGNQYFFAQAWLAGESLGVQAVKSRPERSVERELAGIKQKTEVAALTGRQ